MRDPGALLSARQMRRHLPTLALLGITTYMLAAQFVLGLSVIYAVVLLLAGAFGLVVFFRPLWGYYALIASFAAEFILSVSQTLTFTRLLGIIVFLSWALDALLRRKYRLPRAPVLVVIPLFYATALLSAFPAENIKIVGVRLLTLLQLSILTFITATILQDAKQVGRVAWMIVLSTFASVVYGVANLSTGEQIVLEGLTLDRNRFGMIIALCIPLGFYLYPRSNRLGRAVLILLIGVFLVAEALTYSRGGFLAMMMSLMLSILFVVRSHRVRLGVWVLLFLFVVGIIMPSEYWDRMGSIVPSLREGTDTVGQRYEFWEIATEMIRDHPLLGVGAGNFMHQFSRYSGIISLRRGAAVAHNAFLGVTAELGIPGGLLFASLFLTGFLGLRASFLRARNRGDDDLAALSVAASIILLVFLAQCMNGNYELTKYLWATLGLTAALQRMSAEVPNAGGETSGDGEIAPA